jgi:LDH2 family malate/lactate/ureidoglycolate dehydrogenase
VASADQLEAFAGRVLAAAGLDDVHAAATAAGLVLANLRGVDSHGVLRLLQYEQSIRAGAINPSPRVRVERRRGATALVDADGGYGYAHTHLATATAVELAAEHGLGLAGLRGSHHFGMGAQYALAAAGAGYRGG